MKVLWAKAALPPIEFLDSGMGDSVGQWLAWHCEHCLCIVHCTSYCSRVVPLQDRHFELLEQRNVMWFSIHLLQIVAVIQHGRHRYHATGTQFWVAGSCLCELWATVVHQCSATAQELRYELSRSRDITELINLYSCCSARTGIRLLIADLVLSHI